MSKPELLLHSLFPEIPESDLVFLKTFLTHVKFPKKHRLLQEGEICNFIGLLTKGAIRHYYLTEDGEEVTRWIALPGEFVNGFSSFALQKPSQEYLETISAAEIWMISRSDWQIVYSHSEFFRKGYTRTLEQNYSGIEERLFYMMARPAEARLQHLLTIRPGILEKVPLHYVASMLGITPQHLSRIRKIS